MQVAVAEHLVGGEVVGARVEPGGAAHRGDAPVSPGAPAGCDTATMAFAVPDDRLLPRPHRRHRTVDAPVVQPHRGQTQHDLHRYVLAPAEGTTDGRIDHPDPLDGQVEGVGDLLLVLVGPLARDLHRHPTLVIDVGHACLRLQVGVLLVGELVGRLHHDIGVGPALGHVALADAQRVVGVGGLAVLGVDHRVRSQRLVDVGQHRQRLPPGLDGGRPRMGRVRGLCHHQGEPVSLPSRHVAGQLAAAGVLEADEHGMVGHGETELVHGNVG